MAGKIDSSSVNFARPVPNYALLVCGALVLLCLLVGLIMAAAAGSWALAFVLFASGGGVAAFVWLNLRQTKRASAAESVKQLSWEITLPDSQRNKLTSEVRELALFLEIADEQIADLLSAYIVAEDLALRQIQQEAKLPLMRHVQIGNVPFDGVLVSDDLITCVEVSFLVTPSVRQEKIDAILNKMATVKKNFEELKLGSRSRLLLVLVTQLDPLAEARLRSTVKDKFASTQVDVNIRLLDFEGLQKIYATR